MDTPDYLASATILPAADDGGARRRRTSSWLVAAAAVVVAALVGGVAYGVSSLGGGGRQPADALPGGAVAFASVDLDPPAAQKLDALRYLRQFPSLRARVSGDGDLRKALFDAVAGRAGWSSLDFARDVAPWLGQRVGVAAYPASDGSKAGEPDVVVALQVGDESAARTGLDRLIASSASRPRPGYLIADGYALLAPSRAAAQQAGDRASHGPLANDPHFVTDVSALGEGVATFWMDGKRAGALLPLAGSAGTALGRTALGGAARGGAALGGSAGKDPGTAIGRTAVVVRFDGPDVLELAGRVTGGSVPPASAAGVNGLGQLPASTVAAVGLSGGQDLVTPLWHRLSQQPGHPVDDLVARAHDELGLDLPADLGTLLGSQLVVALDRAGLGSGDLSVGAHVTTADPGRADRLVGRLLAKAPAAVTRGAAVQHRPTAGGYVVATNAAQATRLASPAPPSLGAAAGFRRALPDLDGARLALWVDVSAAAQTYLGDGSGGAAVVPDLAPIAGFGLTAGADAHGGGHFRLRLVTR